VSHKQLATLKISQHIVSGQGQLTQLAVPSRLSKFDNEFEMFLYYLWNRKDPFAQEMALQKNETDDKIFGVPINFNFIIP
jgi:hypothetical protein